MHTEQDTSRHQEISRSLQNHHLISDPLAHKSKQKQQQRIEEFGEEGLNLEGIRGGGLKRE